MIDYSKYTIPQLKTELKCFGLSRTGKKSVLVARITKFLEDASFTSFLKLPVELRLRVWEYALPRRRVVQLSLGPPPWNSLGTTTPRLITAMNIMLSNKEALEAVARRYHPNQAPYWPSEQSSDRPPEWPVIYQRPNFHDDVFHISEIERSIDALGSHGKNLDHIKTVAFNSEHLEECFEEGGIDALLKFSALQEIILVEDFRPPPKQSNRRKSFAIQLLEMMSPPAELLEPPSYLNNYSTNSDHALSQLVVEYLKYSVAKHPEFKKLENVNIYFTQVY